MRIRLEPIVLGIPFFEFLRSLHRIPVAASAGGLEAHYSSWFEHSGGFSRCVKDLSVRSDDRNHRCSCVSASRRTR